MSHPTARLVSRFALLVYAAASLDRVPRCD